MISYIEGKIIYQKNGQLIVNTGNIGYKVFVSPNLVLTKSDRCKLFTYHNIRENAEELYGFLAVSQLELFEQLLSVNGVGPKAAMQIISSGGEDKIIKAIAIGDPAFFMSIPGIGKKVAAKIVLELKSKVGTAESSEIINSLNEDDEFTEALINLGYKKFEILKIIHKIPKGMTSSEEKVRWCLKNLSKQ
jgi:Holliday junction DNA helicase RuvA